MPGPSSTKPKSSTSRDKMDVIQKLKAQVLRYEETMKRHEETMKRQTLMIESLMAQKAESPPAVDPVASTGPAQPVALATSDADLPPESTQQVNHHEPIDVDEHVKKRRADEQDDDDDDEGASQDDEPWETAQPRQKRRPKAAEQLPAAPPAVLGDNPAPRRLSTAPPPNEPSSQLVAPAPAVTLEPQPQLSIARPPMLDLSRAPPPPPPRTPAPQL